MSEEAQRLRKKTVNAQDKLKEDQILVAGPADRPQELVNVAPRTPGVMDGKHCLLV